MILSRLGWKSSNKQVLNLTLEEKELSFCMVDRNTNSQDKLFFSDIFRNFLEESFDVKSHANQAIQGRAITEQLSKLVEGITLLDKEIHSQVSCFTCMLIC